MDHPFVALAPFLASVTRDKVVVFHEKYGNRHVAGSAGFLKIARKVFDERDALPDFYDYPKGDRPDTMAAAMMNKHSDRYAREVELCRLAQAARAGDDEAAAKFLLLRRKHEYEDFSVEPLENLD